MKTPRHPNRWIVLVIAVLAVGGVAAFVSQKKNDKPLGEVVAVKRGKVLVSVQEVGSIEPFRKVDIKSKVAGQVAEVTVDVGDVVKAGTVLMRLDPLDAERDAKQAEASRRVTESQLQVARAQLELKKKAHGSGALSDLELSTADGEVKRLAAQAALNGVQEAAARDRLSYTQIKAPIDGVVLARNVQPGEMVTPGVASMVDGKPLLVVAQIEKLLVRTELNQLDVARLKVGDKVEVKVDALPGQKFVGEIYRIAAMAQKSERRKESNLQVFPVDVVINRDQGGTEALRPGMMADINIALEQHENVLTVPLEAVVRDENKTQVWKVGAAKEHDKPIEVVVGLQNDKVAEILSGVEEGAQIRVRPAEEKRGG